MTHYGSSHITSLSRKVRSGSHDTRLGTKAADHSANMKWNNVVPLPSCAENLTGYSEHGMVGQSSPILRNQRGYNLLQTVELGGRSRKAAGGEAKLSLPFTLYVGAGRGGQPDLRVNLFKFSCGSLAEPCGGGGSIELDKSCGHAHNFIQAGNLALRVGGTLMCQLFFPTTMMIVSRFSCICGIGSLLFGRFRTRKTLVGRLYPQEVEENPDRSEASATLRSHLDAFEMFTTQMSYAVAAIVVGRYVWRCVHRRSQRIAEASVAMVKVSRDYKRVHRSVLGMSSQAEVEAAWLKAHKVAAQQVAHFLDDHPESPPLKPFIDLWESMTVWAHLLADQGRSSHAFGLSDTQPTVFCLNMILKKETQVISPAGNTLGSDSNSAKSKLNNLERHHNFSQMQSTQSSTENSLIGIQSHERGALSSSTSETSIWDSVMEAEDFIMPRSTHYSCEASCSGALETLDLPVYGRGDHSDVDAAGSSVQEKAVLAMRAMKLFLLFMPVLLLGGIAVAISRALEPKASASAPSSSTTDLSASRRRKMAASAVKSWACKKLLNGCRNSGAAFIKWGQWSSSRGDLFPEEFCEVLSELHDQAPAHSWEETKQEIENGLGAPYERIFSYFEETPIASGSIAQVHRAILSVNGKDIPVVVKVRHPRVDENICKDFKLLKPLASWASNVPFLKGLPLKETVSQFSHTMTAQTDLRVEAVHLKQMARNFEPNRQSIVIPTLVDGLVSKSVIVESFEEGKCVSYYMKNPSPINTTIVALGVDAYLKMLLKDNLVHTDLHPGNILVRRDHIDGQEQVQIVLLDLGLVEELQPDVRKHFISFLNMISKGDGENAARHFLQWSSDQNCQTQEAFTRDMIDLFNKQADIQSKSGIDLDNIIKSVLALSRKHQVSISSKYAALVIGVCIIVGFATGLDPRVNVMDAATPVLLAYSLTGKVVGRMYG